MNHTNYHQEKKSLSFEYRMRIDYEETVNKSHFTIKAIPVSTQRQTLKDLKVSFVPETMYSDNKDSFGNYLYYGSLRERHKSFEYKITGSVEIGQILFEDYAKEEEIMIYRNSHGLNRPGDRLRAYFESLKEQLEENTYVNTIFLLRRLYQDYAYEKAVTDVNTTAEEAWKLGRGVCQDYVHIFIALCHLAGIPARYVAGIISGEGESHAWAEILYHGKWIGMDPTNDMLVDRSYIKFCHGRDASDCLLNRGIIYGGGCQKQSIYVMVNEEK